MAKTQYKLAKELSLQQRLKQVMRLHMQGKSHFAIARDMEYSIEQAKKDVATISRHCQEWDDLGEHLKDTVARTGELLKTLKHQQDILQSQLDWANEWVVQLDSLGIPLRERLDNGELGSVMYGPRNPALSLSLSSKISDLIEKQGKLLGVYAKTMDVTVKLEESERTQVLVLEAIQEAAPELQAKIVRKLKALRASEGFSYDGETLEGEYLERKQLNGS